MTLSRVASLLLPLVLVAPGIMLAQAPTPVPPAAPPTSPPPTPSVSCTNDRTPPNDGDLALASKNYPAAETFFRAVLAKDPTAPDASIGVVRALIGEDKVAEAKSMAATRLAEYPHSSLAQVAVGEAAYRDANFDAATQSVKQALAENSCEAQAIALYADLESLFALFASEAKHIALAHKLRPTDELIRRDWIDSLPRKQRAIELEKYLGEANHLSDKDRNDYTNESEHLKARRPGECRITSKTESVAIPFLPIFENATHPRAYGLDVSFNGTRRRMQVDTGASGITLTAGAAKRLNLTPEYHVHTGGIGDEGEVESYLAHVEKIQIGDVQLSNCMVEVLGKSKLDVDGLIGIDVFSRWLATLDYQNARLLLNPLPPRPSAAATPAPVTSASIDQQAESEEETPADPYYAPQMANWLHVIRIAHNLLLPAIINKSSQHYIELDTGASQTVLSLPFAREVGKTHEDTEVEFTGISGKVKKVYTVDSATLHFGNLALAATSYFAFDLTNISHDTGVEVSGFVGLPTLQRLTMTIDYRDNLIQLKYDPKHDTQRF